MQRNKLRTYIIIPFIVMLILISIITISGINHLQEGDIEKEVTLLLYGANDFLEEHLHLDAKTMYGFIDFMQHDQELQAAWLAKDREQLLKVAGPIFRKITYKYGITHFYFHGLDKVNFLRVHKPETYGDKIQRYTLDRASANQRGSSSGLELGVLGTLTLRAVSPWVINGAVEGYIELGEDLEDLIPELSKILGVEVLVTIDKEYLTEKQYQNGLKMFGRSGDWNLLTNSAIIISTLDKLPSPITQLIQEGSHKQLSPRTLSVGKNIIYSMGSIDLHDAGQRVIGEITLLRDISADMDKIKKLSRFLIGLSVLLSSALIGFFYYYLGRVADRFEAARASLLKSETTLEGILKVAPTGIGLLKDRFFVWVNEQMLILTGYLNEEILGKSSRMIYESDEEFQRIGTIKHRIAHGDALSEVDTRWVCKDGRIIDVHLRSTALDQKDPSKGTIFTAFDISERKKAEKAQLEAKAQIHRLSQELINVQETERKLMALDLHDNVAQELSALKVMSESIFADPQSIQPQCNAPCKAQIQQKMEAWANVLKRCIGTVRELSYNLLPSGLEQMGIKNAIADYCREFSNKHNLPIKFSSSGRDTLIVDYNISLNMYRLVQEALNNIVKHANACQVTVKLITNDQTIVLQIEDDGQGYDLAEVNKRIIIEKRLGLLGMRARVELLGGWLSIYSRPQEGTRLIIEIPWDKTHAS